MKIELKNVHFSEALSEETNAFTADIYVNGKKAGYARNDGRGGNTDTHHYMEQKVLFNECEDWLTKQPQLNIGTETDPFMIDCDMESTVDHLFEEWLKVKEEKRIQNLCKKNIVFEKSHGVYGLYSWKNVTIDQFLQNPIGRQRIQKVVNDIKNDGFKIINTNLVGIEL